MDLLSNTKGTMMENYILNLKQLHLSNILHTGLTIFKEKAPIEILDMFKRTDHNSRRPYEIIAKYKCIKHNKCDNLINHQIAKKWNNLPKMILEKLDLLNIKNELKIWILNQ